jgi:hypothetical protein
MLLAQPSVSPCWCRVPAAIVTVTVSIVSPSLLRAWCYLQFHPGGSTCIFNWPVILVSPTPRPAVAGSQFDSPVDSTSTPLSLQVVDYACQQPERHAGGDHGCAVHLDSESHVGSSSSNCLRFPTMIIMMASGDSYFGLRLRHGQGKKKVQTNKKRTLPVAPEDQE